MATLERLKLSGWKSIKEAEITFGRLNVLVGANGSGKSNLVSFFRLLSEMMAGRLQPHIAEAGHADVLLHFGVKHTRELSFELAFRANLGFLEYGADLRLQSVGYGLLIAEESVRWRENAESTPESWSSAASLESVLPGPWHPQEEASYRDLSQFMRGARPHHFHDTTDTAAVRRPGYIDDNRRLRSDAGNLAAMLYLYKQTRKPVYHRIVGAVQQVAPFLDDFVLEPRRLNPKEIQLDWYSTGSDFGPGSAGPDYLLGPHQLSDGTLRMIALATLLLQPESDLPPLIVIDEPELGLHPAALGILAGLLKQAAVHTQVLVATQSATLLNHFEPQDVIVVDAKDGISTFRRLDPEPYREWIEEYGLSDLWERNVIGGGPYR